MSELGIIKEKHCSTCKLLKTIDNFYFNKHRQKYFTDCKPCRKKSLIKFRETRQHTVPLPPHLKQCLSCNEVLSIDNFYIVAKTQKFGPNCKPCKRSYNKLYSIEVCNQTRGKNPFIKFEYRNARIKMEDGSYIYLENISKEDVHRLLKEQYLFVLKDNFHKYL